jgi:hypothetical protein
LTVAAQHPKGGGPPGPGMTQTVTCVDPRVVPESFLGYKILDEKPLGEFCSAACPTEAEY